jgi:hypothetical protein
MIESKKAVVYFVDGYAARSTLIGVASYLEELSDTDAEYTRLYSFNGDTGRWGHVDVKHAIVSMVRAIRDGVGCWHCLSKRGVVVTVQNATQTETTISDAGTGPGNYGYVSRIRKIGEDFFICGYRRQVYKLDRDNWAHFFDANILADRSESAIGFNDIDGASDGDMFAVGWKGEIYHFDGSAWAKVDSPTNSNLYSIRCSPGQPAYACGQAGTVLRFSDAGWESLITPGVTQDLWSVELFKGVPYFASLDGLYRLEQDQLVPVSTGLAHRLDGYKLHASDDVLWSFGHERLASFDGATWTTITCPDNA